MLLIYFGIVLYGHVLRPELRAWDRMGVPTRSPAFADLRNISTGAECAARGLDVLRTNPCDPWKRRMNYPRVWISIWQGAGLTVAHTNPVGVVLGALFLAAVLWMAGPLLWWQGLLFGAALLSPPIMLGVERGNIDILMFTVLILAGRALSRSRYGTGTAILFTAGALKLFPIFGASALRQIPREWALRLGMVLALAFGVYVVVNLEDIRLIGAAVPRATWFSFGSRVLPARLLEILRVDAAYLSAVSAVLAAIVAVVALALARRMRTSFFVPPAERPLDGVLAMMGAGLFAGVFVLGNHFDYRLGILLFFFPWLLRAAADSTAARLGLTMLLGIFWFSAWSPLRLDDILTWAWFGLSVFWLGRPGGIRLAARRASDAVPPATLGQG